MKYKANRRQLSHLFCTHTEFSDDTGSLVLLVYWCKKADVWCAVQMERWNKSALDINATIDALGDKCKGLLGMHTLSGFDTASYPNAWKRKGVRLASTHSTNLIQDPLQPVVCLPSSSSRRICGLQQTFLLHQLITGTAFLLSLYIVRKKAHSCGEGSATQRDLLITGTAFFLSLYTVRKKAHS